MISNLDINWTIRAKLSSQIKLIKRYNTKDKIKINNNIIINETKTNWDK